MPRWYLKDQQGRLFPAEVSLMNLKESKLLHSLGWETGFNWTTYISDKSKGTPFKIIAVGNNNIQGTISFRSVDGFVFVDLLENSPLNRASARQRIYVNVVDVLLGVACLESFIKGFEGIVSFESKTNLISYYQERFNSKQIRNSQKMFIDTRDAAALIALYYR